MARYAVGQPVRLSTQVRNLAGALENAGAITLTIQKPDLTTQPFVSPTNSGAGLYHQDIGAVDLTQVGLHRYKWVSTGANAGVSTGSFSVVDPFAPSHVSFEDAKARLNISSLSDAEIEDMLASAVAEQERQVGPVAPRAATKVVVPVSGILNLGSPVVSLTSITPYAGVALSLVGITVDNETGFVSPAPTSFFTASSYTVVYVAGRNPVPQDLVEAALLRMQHSYESQRGPAELPLAEAVEGGSSYRLLLMAQDKERPYARPPGTA